ncbi:GNAT family N-acetyltransferase [Pseudoroseicyclus sp. CLL3-39]|uniref:GNAT family N-acetyltransferase n=2 Tax=Pseudoroseicyclus tamaricis TaxID=2705421 RepID=A0A6B2JUZ4_9RHOB|nr:GNAT family N-acetyltransferase [Pseudoroseicyclus tamaricis]
MLGAAREDLGPPLPAGYHAAFAAIRADANQLLLVAEEEGEVVGTMQLTFLPGLSHKGAWRGQLEAVRVASARRGQGLGRQMVLWGIEECRRRGCAQMQLTSHNDRAEAHRFYRGLGFAQSHSGFKLKL